MKRLREEKEVTAHAPWLELCGDLVRAIVCTELSLLPSLYLVCKSFHNSLSNSSPSLWKAYFYFVPGYSDYEEAADLPEKWKVLVRFCHPLYPTYYLHIRHPAWPCGHPLPQYLPLPMRVCECGVTHDIGTLGKVSNWEDLKKAVADLPSMDKPCELRFLDLPAVIGCTGRMAGPSYYEWNPAQSCIYHVQELNSETKSTRRTLAAAPEKILAADASNWRAAIFVGFV